MEEYFLPNVYLTTEAKFDYASIFDLLEVIDGESFLPKRFKIPGLEREIEDYIMFNKKLWYKQYFKVKYLEEESGLMLYVFLRKLHYKESTWEIVGICCVDDWNEDLEEMGAIKGWLDTKIEYLPYEEDWVEVRYRNKILEQLDLIYDIGGRDGFIRCCEELVVELSDKYSESELNNFTARKIRRYIGGKTWSSETANELIELLDKLLERERENYDRFDF